MSASSTPPSPSTPSARPRRKRKRRTSVASSGSTERSACLTLKTWQDFTEGSSEIQNRGKTMKSLYVGNLPHSTTEPQLRTLFEAHGAVERVNIVMDKETGRSKGFAFVEMTDTSQA